VPEDWAAVAEAVKGRMAALALSQRDLAKRSNVSQALVREIQHHTAERRRSPRTLEALSVALGWPSHYLSAVAAGRAPFTEHEPGSAGSRSQLSIIEQRLAGIANQIDNLTSMTTVIMKSVVGSAWRPEAETERSPATAQTGQADHEHD
jgi:transcriptional regulator with XRE-family HTH domain